MVSRFGVKAAAKGGSFCRNPLEAIVKNVGEFFVFLLSGPQNCGNWDRFLPMIHVEVLKSHILHEIFRLLTES